MALNTGMGWALDWAAVVVVAATLLYLYLTWNFSYWSKRGVPHAEASLLFGSLKDSMFGGKNLGEVYQDIYWKLEGHAWGGFYKNRQPGIVLRDPELIKDVLVRNFANFQDNDVFVDEKKDPVTSKNPFIARGDKWRKIRTQLTPAFTSGKIKPLYALMEDVCKNLLTFIDQHGGPIEAKQMSSQYTTDVVASCTFGIEANCFQNTEADSEFLKMGKKMFEPSFWRNIQITLLFVAPKIASLFGIRFFTTEVEAFYRNLLAEVRTLRQEQKNTRHDFLQILLQQQQKENSGGSVVYTDDHLLAHSLMFFSDGFETSASVMAFVLFELAVHPEIQRRLREEVDDALKRHDGRLEYDVVSGLQYLDMVISEAMRMYPPGVFMAKVCTKPYDLRAPNGNIVTIEKDTAVIIPVYAIHHDPEYYPEPSRFDPERFNEENKQELNRFAYLPFGEGPRVCIGSRFAYAQMKAAIVAILSRFEIQRCDKTVYPITLDPNYFLTAAKDKLWVKFVKRVGN